MREWCLVPTRLATLHVCWTQAGCQITRGGAKASPQRLAWFIALYSRLGVSRGRRQEEVFYGSSSLRGGVERPRRTTQLDTENQYMYCSCCQSRAGMQVSIWSLTHEDKVERGVLKNSNGPNMERELCPNPSGSAVRELPVNFHSRSSHHEEGVASGVLLPVCWPIRFTGLQTERAVSTSAADLLSSLGMPSYNCTHTSR